MEQEINNIINQWNWGAFLLGPVWSLVNRVAFGKVLWVPSIALMCITLLQLTGAPLLFRSEFMEKIYYFVFPIFYVAISLVLGFKGNRWSWETGRWLSIDDFKKSQENWLWAGIIFSIPLNIATFIFTYFLIYWTVHILDLFSAC
jgi:hypothetical protein